MHVHIAAPDGIAKFWLEPIVALEKFYGLIQNIPDKDRKIVKEHQDEFKNAWCRHFSK